MRDRGIDEEEKEEFNQNPFSRTSDRYTENKGVSGQVSYILKKLPFKFKLIIIAIGVAILLFFLIIVAIISADKYQHLDYSDNTKETINDNENDISDYIKMYEEEYNDTCQEGEPGCTEEEIKKSEEYLKQQKKFYKTFKKQSKKLSSRGQHILLATIYYGYNIEEFSEDGGAFINTSDEEDNLIDTDSDVDITKEKKSLSGLAKKLRKSGEEGFYEYLITDDYLDDKPIAQNFYNSYASEHGLSSNYSSWDQKDKQAVRKQMVEEIKEIVNEYEGSDGQNSSVLANCSSGEYWWPVGSKETTTSGDVTFASGEPVSSITDAYPEGISSYFGNRTPPKAQASSNHGAIDIPVGEGTNVIASMDGTVTKAEMNGNCGNQVSITDSKGNSLLYCHLSKFKVKAGDKVKQGQVIALSGNTGNSTGPHLHFGIIVNGSPVDPTEYVSISNPRGGGNSSAQCSSGGYIEGGDVQQTVCLTFKSHGYSDNGVAGILANIAQESSFKPDTKNGLGCIGLVQWCDSGQRKSKYLAFAGDDWTNVQKQLEFVEKELNQDYYSVVKNELLDESSDVYTQAAYFCCRFETPEVCQGANQLTPPTGKDCDNRAKNASNYVNYVKNGCK